MTIFGDLLRPCSVIYIFTVEVSPWCLYETRSYVKGLSPIYKNILTNTQKSSLKPGYESTEDSNFIDAKISHTKILELAFSLFDLVANTYPPISFLLLARLCTNLETERMSRDYGTVPVVIEAVHFPFKNL